jgi:hypothetical protein
MFLIKTVEEGGSKKNHCVLEESFRTEITKMGREHEAHLEASFLFLLGTVLPGTGHFLWLIGFISRMVSLPTLIICNHMLQKCFETFSFLRSLGPFGTKLLFLVKESQRMTAPFGCA